MFWVFGSVPMFTFEMNRKVAFLPILVLFHCYITVCISVIMPINDVPRKLSWNGLMSMGTCYLYLGVYPRALLTSIWEVVFWTVSNCDSHKLRQIRNSLPSQFVMKTVTWHIDSNNTENVFWVLVRVAMFTFDMNMKSCIFAHFDVI